MYERRRIWALVRAKSVLGFSLQQMRSEKIVKIFQKKIAIKKLVDISTTVMLDLLYRQPSLFTVFPNPGQCIKKEIAGSNFSGT